MHSLTTLACVLALSTQQLQAVEVGEPAVQAQLDHAKRAVLSTEPSAVVQPVRQPLNPTAPAANEPEATVFSILPLSIPTVFDTGRPGSVSLVIASDLGGGLAPGILTDSGTPTVSTSTPATSTSAQSATSASTLATGSASGSSAAVTTSSSTAAAPAHTMGLIWNGLVGVGAAAIFL